MSSDGHQGFIHKSYQVLFVIYAPIALVTIVLQAFSNKHLPYLFITAAIAAAVSVILAAIMWVLFFKHRSLIKEQRETGLPFLIRHQFILMYLPVAFSSMGFCAFYTFEKYVRLALDQERMVLLLPITNSMGSRIQDAQQLRLALGTYFIENPEVASKYQLHIRDHNNTYNQALLDYVVNQTKQGSRYFICAYSDVCKKLIKAVHDLPDGTLPLEPVFVSTMASSMNMPLEKNSAYRFYPRTRETSQALAGYATRFGARTASFIATDDEYGHNSAREFTNAWQSLGGTVLEGVFIDPIASEEVAQELIQAHFSKDTMPDSVYVSLYESINPSLKTLSEKTKILLGVNYQVNLIDSLVSGGANVKNLAVAQPLYKVQHEYFVNTAGLFLFLTLNKVIKVDRKLKETGEGDFDTYWWTTGDPAFISFDREEKDYRILMTAHPYNQSIFGKPHRSAL